MKYISLGKHTQFHANKSLKVAQTLY